MSAPQQLFVAEGTFGVLDGGDIPVDTADWSNGLAAPMSHGAIILTGIRTGDVLVTAEARDTPPQKTVNRPPWRVVGGHGPPRYAVVDEIADAVDDLPSGWASGCPPVDFWQAGTGNSGSMSAHSASVMSEG
jgi:hypothetical protein